MSDVLSLGKKRAEELGLQMSCDPGRFGAFYQADDIHKVLGEGVYTSCRQNELEYWQALQPSKAEVYPGDTHQALLIGIKPIVIDSAEQLIKDLAGHANYQYQDGKWAINAKYWIDRAKALLEKP